MRVPPELYASRLKWKKQIITIPDGEIIYPYLKYLSKYNFNSYRIDYPNSHKNIYSLISNNTILVLTVGYKRRKYVIITEDIRTYGRPINYRYEEYNFTKVERFLKTKKLLKDLENA